MAVTTQHLRNPMLPPDPLTMLQLKCPLTDPPMAPRSLHIKRRSHSHHSDQSHHHLPPQGLHTQLPHLQSHHISPHLQNQSHLTHPHLNQATPPLPNPAILHLQSPAILHPQNQVTLHHLNPAILHLLNPAIPHHQNPAIPHPQSQAILHLPSQAILHPSPAILPSPPTPAVMRAQQVSIPTPTQSQRLSSRPGKRGQGTAPRAPTQCCCLMGGP